MANEVGNGGRRQDTNAGRDGYIAGGDLTININYPPDGEQAKQERFDPSAASRAAEYIGPAAIHATIARARFLAAFKPTFSYTDYTDRWMHAYDPTQVDQFLKAVRMLACKNMTELQVHLASTPRAFKMRKKGGYKVEEVDSFMGDFDAAIGRYFTEVVMSDRPGKNPLSASSLLGATESARARFIAALSPTFNSFSYHDRWEPKYYRTYDIAQVDQFLAEARMLAYKGVTEIQAYLALAPRCFKTINRGRGYTSGTVEEIMKGLDDANEEYAKELTLLWHS